MAKPRTQVDVPFGQVSLRSTIQGAGRNQVFVAPQPRLNSAQMLAKNLAQFSNVLGQFSNVQKQRGREAAMALTNEEVIEQLDGTTSRRFNPFDKIGFQKQFSEDVYARGFDLKIKPQLTQLGINIKNFGVERVPDALALDALITEGLDKINQEALENIGDDEFQKYAHNVLFSNAAAAFRSKTTELWNNDRQQYRKDSSAENADRMLYNSVEGIFDMPSTPTGGIVVLPKHRATAYGLASIDPTTAEDQRKADAGTPGYEGFSQTVGASGRTLIPGYSVASNYYPQGTILDIDGKEYRVDDTGGMDDNVVDFYAGDDKSMYDSFAKKNINSVKVVDPLSKSPQKVKGGVQQWANAMDNNLYDSGHTTPSARKVIMMQSIENVVTDYANRGDFIQAREILDSLEDTRVNNLPIFKGVFVSNLEEKIQRIEEKTSVDNVKIIEDKADNDWLNYNSRLNDVKNTMVSQEVIPIDRAEEFEDTYETESIKIKEELIDLKNAAKESGDNTSALVYDKLIEKTQDAQIKHGNIIETFSKTYLASDALERYEIETSSLEEIASKIFKEESLKGKLWQNFEVPNSFGGFDEEPSLINQKVQEDIEEMASEIQVEWNQKNRKDLRTLKSLNLYKTDGQIQDEVNSIIQKNSEEAQKSIDKKISEYVRKAEAERPVVTPTPTSRFEQEVQRGLMEGDTVEEAKRFGLSETLKDKETFDAKEGRVILDLDKVFGFGDSRFGNYEKEDFDKYKSLYEKTKETGVFKGKNEDVSRYYQNKKTILKESDFFAPLVTTVKRFTYERPSLTEMGVGGLYPSGVYKSSETEYRNAKRDIRAYLIETGVTLEDAQQGMFMDYPLKEIIQRNWEKMPILSFSELQFTGEVEKILKKNNLDKPYYMRDSFGNPVTKPRVTADEFIEAQRKIITDQTK